MDMKGLDAANAYASALKQLQGAGDAGATSKVAGAADGGSAFADLLTETVQDTRAATQGMEEVSAKAVAGQADMVDVVTAVSNAEMMVTTVVNVRDKVISAYQEVLKMPI